MFLLAMFWLLMLCALILMVAHRLKLTNDLYEFEVNRANPLDACASFNRFLFAELILHTIFTFAAIVPGKSPMLLVINGPFLVRSWFLYQRQKLYFSPLQVVRDLQRHQMWCYVQIGVCGLSAAVVIFRLFLAAL